MTRALADDLKVVAGFVVFWTLLVVSLLAH